MQSGCTSIDGLTIGMFMQALREGQVWAFNALESKFSPRMVAFVSRLIKNELDAGILVKETLERITLVTMDFHSYDQLEGYIYRSCKNAAVDYQRSLKSYRAHIVLMANYPEASLNARFHAETADDAEALRTSRFNQVVAEIRRLPVRQRYVMLLLLSGKRIPEVVTITGWNVNTVRQLKKRGIEKLGSLLSSRQRGNQV